jgi:glycosyltransferase involved in cell wall biosynthesis
MRDKTRILFVVPGYTLGGTLSSLRSILNSGFSNKYDIEVFAINNRAEHPTSLAQFDIGLNELSTAYYSDYSSFSFTDRLRYFYLKILKQVPPIARRIERWVVKRTIKKIERKKQYDYVVAFQEGRATECASYFKCPDKIAWIHCDYAKSYGDNVDEFELYNHFSRIVCVSDYTREGFVERYPLLADKTVSIHNLFDAKSVIEKSKAAIDDTRFDHSLFTIISLGRVCDVKRFNLIPKIAAALKQSNLSFHWYIMGESASDLDLKRLRDAIAENGVKDEVIYLGGKDNPYPYLKSADLMVSVSKSEACPMIFNEARILNIPVLSADFGSAGEFIEDGYNGFISTIERMPDIICELMNKPEILGRIRQVDYQDSSEVILNQLYQIFR